MATPAARLLPALLALLLLALAPASAPARAQQVPASAFALLGRLGGKAPTTMVMDGDRAYLVSDKILTVAELGPDDSLALHGEIELPQAITAIAAANSYIYAITKHTSVNFNLRIIDAADASQPREVFRYDFANFRFVEQVEVYRGRLYLRSASIESSQNGDIWVYSLANPADPTFVARLTIRAYGTGYPATGRMSFADGRLYVGTGEIFELDAQPRPAGTFIPGLDNYSGSMVSDGEYLYYGAYSSLRIFEMLQDADPVLRGELTGRDFSTLQVDGGRLYAADTNANDPKANLRVYDLADKVTPRLLGEGGGAAYQLWLTPRGLLGFTPGLLKHYNVADPAAISAEELWRWDELTVTSTIAVRGGRLYSFVAGALRITDLGNPADPASLGSLSFLEQGQTPLAIDAQGGLAFVVLQSGSSRSLQLLDVSDPANPRARGRVSLAGVPNVDTYQLRVDGATLYLDGRNPSRSVNLGLIDFGDPDAPRLAEVYKIEEKPVYVANGVAFLPLSDQVRFHDAASGQVRGLFPQPGVTDIAVRGDTLYLAHNGGLQIVDISDLARSELLGSYSAPNSAAHELLLQGDRAYLYSFWPSTGASFTQALDVSDPATPRLLGLSPQPALDLQAVGELFVGRTLEGVVAVDPASGKTCCPYRAGYAAAVRHLVDGGRVYLVDSAGRLHILQPPGRYDFPTDLYLPLLQR